MRVKYSYLTRKLRVKNFDSTQIYVEIGIFKLASRAWFLPIREKIEVRLDLLFHEPKNPYEVQEVSFLLKELKKVQPVLVLDLPDWTGARNEKIGAEWFAALRELDKSLAQKVRELVTGEGKNEYLRQK